MRIFALAFLLCLASVSEAAQMPLSVLPGGAVVFKPIQSVRERKFADLVQQKTDFSCGAAALATKLRCDDGTGPVPSLANPVYCRAWRRVTGSGLMVCIRQTRRARLEVRAFTIVLPHHAVPADHLHLFDADTGLSLHAKLRDAATHLLRVLNDILDVSTMESGNFKLNTAPVHLPSIAKEVDNLMRFSAQQKGITLHLRIDRFDGALGSELRLDGAFSVISSSGERLSQHHFNIKAKAGDSLDSLISAHNQALAELASLIVPALPRV
mgnify:CR=1 FL=1